MRLANDGDRETIARHALDSGSVIDLGGQHGLWGQFLRGEDFLLHVEGPSGLKNSPTREHAANITEAHIIEVLCALGRETIDFYTLNSVAPAEALEGFFETIESARHEGHVRYLGLNLTLPGSFELWRANDAFEYVLVAGEGDASFSGLTRSATTDPRASSLAKERRVGIVGVGGSE